jgi:hypothetical protein
VKAVATAETVNEVVVTEVTVARFTLTPVLRVDVVTVTKSPTAKVFFATV